MPKTIKQPSYQKAHEKEFERAMKYMIDIISERFRNQALKELNKGTVEKFADAQLCKHISFSC